MRSFSFLSLPPPSIYRFYQFLVLCITSKPTVFPPRPTHRLIYFPTHHLLVYSPSHHLLFKPTTNDDHYHTFTTFTTFTTRPGSATRPVNTLSFKDVARTFLKNGLRPPLLKEVLRAAQCMGPEAQLVIELKSSAGDIADALVQFFIDYPDLVANVGVVMSFDLYVIHHFNREFNRLVLANDRTRGDHAWGTESCVRGWGPSVQPVPPVPAAPDASSKRSNALSQVRVHWCVVCVCGYVCVYVCVYLCVVCVTFLNG